jgi:hypothetical protein
LHVGGRQLDTGLDFLSIDVTDDGAALTTLDGGIWFSDGATVERIGGTLGVRDIERASITYFAGRPREWVVSAGAGSLLAWMEFSGRRVDRPELVVYDSGDRAVLARRPIEVSARNSATVLDVVDGVVFVAEDDRGSFDPAPGFRYDVDTGVLEQVDDASMEAARRGIPRALVVGSAAHGALLHTPDRTLADTHSVQTLDVRGSRLDGLVDPRTGAPVEILVPERYDGQTLWFTQWIDDDRFAVVTHAGIGELLVCRRSGGRCEVVVEGFTHESSALTPGDGLRGSERALGRATRAASEPGP